VNRTILLDYKIQFERRALPVPTQRRRASFFELMPWERDTTRCANADVDAVEVHRPATPLPCIVSLAADKAETEFGAAKNEFVARPTLHCPE
jgi:hypothetical protein